MYTCLIEHDQEYTVHNNDILRRLRYTFNYNDKKMAELFLSAGFSVTREEISQWLKKDDDENFVIISDEKLATFLNGFINEKRGKKEGTQATPEKRLSNNIILTKLKIALNLKAEQLIELLASVDFRISKPELSAFSRKRDHKHFRECKDQVLRNLLQAIDKRYHVKRSIKLTTNKVKSSNTANTKPSAESKTKPNSSHNNGSFDGARPNASHIYINPKADIKSKRARLKLAK